MLSINSFQQVVWFKIFIHGEEKLFDFICIFGDFFYLVLLNFCLVICLKLRIASGSLQKS